MLTSDYNIRPNFEEIIEKIEEKTFHTNSNISSKDSTIMNEMNKDYSEKIAKPAASNKVYGLADLNQVKEKLNFDMKPANSLIAQPPPFLNANNFNNFDAAMGNNKYSSLPAPLFPSFSNPPPPLPIKAY